MLTREEQPQLPAQTFRDPVQDKFSGSGRSVHADTPTKLREVDVPCLLLHLLLHLQKKAVKQAGSVSLIFNSTRIMVGSNWARGGGTHCFGSQVLRGVPVVELQQSLSGSWQTRVVMAPLWDGVRFCQRGGGDTGGRLRTFRNKELRRHQQTV